MAHCTSSKGVLSEIKGETRTEIFKHPNLLAVETSQHDFTDATKIEKRTRAIDLLDGEDENFHYRKLGIYISSDSHESGIEGHTLKGLGSKFTYFKVDDEINLESLRQCFIDRDVRIRQSFEYSTNVYPTINKIEIKGGFFNNQNANFHKGLNSILGSKGAGKSLLVELLRFGLNKASSQADIYKDHISKLEKRLQTYGKVLIELIDDTGMTHLLERTFNPTENNPYNSSEQESIANSFNTIFLSQNEIIKIAEDESEQINFIDSFFDFQYFKNKINNTEKDISIFDDILADGLKAFSDVFEVQAQINILNKEKQKLDKILSDKVYDSFKTHEEKENAFTNQENFIDEIISELELKLDEYRKKTAPDYSKTNLSEDPAIKRNTDTLNDALNEYRNKLSESLETIKQLQNKISEERKPWNKTFKEVKSKYEAHIRTTGGDRKTQEAKRIRIVNELNELNNRLTALNKKKENIKNTIEDRNKKINELFSIYKSYSNERKAKCQKFEEQSNGKLKIQIKESTNFDDFKNSLLQLKKGSYIQNADIDAICSNITPKEFIECLFNYEVSKKTQNCN